MTVKRPTPPSVIDDDNGYILVKRGNEDLRVYTYNSDDERRVKMQRARDYVEGWVDASEKIFSRVDVLMNRISSPDGGR